nr:type IV toxin-antitoxin system AbiEi family antitoxin domain-containing protein [uncultured Nocardioides sp.]
MAEFNLSSDDVLLRRDLIAIGLTDRDIHLRVVAGDLTRLRHGAYVATELVKEFGDVEMARARARAVLRRAHPTAVLSHQTALSEHGVDAWGVGFDETHLTRTDGRPGRREAGVVHHRATLGRRWWVVRDGVRATHPARAAIEVATAHGAEAGLVAACGVLNRELTTLAELQEVAKDAMRWPGSLGTRLVLARADARLTNVAEARVWHFFFEHGIARPEPQVEVRDAHGNLLGIVDFLWRALGVFLEFDGRIKYDSHRRPGESLADYLMREKRREEQICVEKGWICIRITWADLQRPAVLARRIRKVLESRMRVA